ncbi:hypothetical protein G4B88_013150 [Cannabis sativa]|uniref:Ubiquitin-like protease family profile domain-containing protein n=1 Tax=Cannabis sativa TaxID=3483 RepID=A0A7J6I2X2_CANSA|nr:hypothetical protein G4B88_013150 [Cannabis sativa]
MGASSSSAHENVSRLEFEELKKSKQYEVVEENIDVDATIASAIGSSTNVSASAETSEKNDLEMIVFQETPILRPQKRDRKKGAFVEKNNDISVLSLSHNVAQYIRGGKILCATPWHLVHHAVMPINVKLQDHWICGRLNIAERRIYLYNSLRSGRYMTAAKEACKPFSVILPYYFSMLDFRGLRNEPKFSTMESFPIVAVDGLPEQVTA